MILFKFDIKRVKHWTIPKIYQIKHFLFKYK